MVDVDDVQAIALSSYSRLGHAAFLPLRASTDAKATRAWLAALQGCGILSFGHIAKSENSAANVAFSHRGLDKLGLEKSALEEFGIAFQRGMTAGNRPSQFGDVEESDPDLWSWGGSEKTEADVLLLLYAHEKDDLQPIIRDARDTAHRHGLELVPPEPLLASWPECTGVSGNREHFGFVDGLSQPGIDYDGQQRGKIPADSLLAEGELLLGYQREDGQVSEGPTVLPSQRATDAKLPRAGSGARHDFGRNGTYLVFRQLQQHVVEFWRFVTEHSGKVGSLELCAAKLMGRWRDGTPLTLADQPPASLDGVHTEKAFRFGDYDDAAGLRCPLGAHIRRANPRDTLPGTANGTNSLTETRRHRILRRARPYGEPISGWPRPEEMSNAAGSPDDIERGLHFICLNADIERQFEHVQAAWLNSAAFVNGANYEVDPIVGVPRPGTSFIIPEKPSRLTWTRPFVTTRGGGYFFLPSKKALTYLSLGE